jgi:hypothetical protein
MNVSLFESMLILNVCWLCQVPLLSYEVLTETDDFRRDVLYSKEIDRVLHKHAKALQVKSTIYITYYRSIYTTAFVTCN